MFCNSASVLKSTWWLKLDVNGQKFIMTQFTQIRGLVLLLLEKLCTLRENETDGLLKRLLVVSISVWLNLFAQLPRCLCIHIQRTVWLDSGIPMKRCDSVSFPEVLDMSPFVYHKYPTPKVRPATLNIDASMRLVGGRKEAQTERQVESFLVNSNCCSFAHNTWQFIIWLFII